jgi:ubiquinone/menaquinone biosynthesis C-methylase UbiE
MGFTNIETQIMDGKNMEMDGAFDAVISRVGLIYFPDQQKALMGMLRALKPGGRLGAIVYSKADANQFFPTPVSIRFGVALIFRRPHRDNLGHSALAATVYWTTSEKEIRRGMRSF